VTAIDELLALRDEAQACTACGLAATRTKVVWGTGNIDRPLVAFVGEAPGANEDLQGEPFVGRSGKVLNSWIDWMGLTRAQVYILNPVLCRPPKNRNPKPEEIEACSRFFQGQLERLEPRTIVALGRFATNVLVDSRRSLAALRGAWHTSQWGPVRVTYHPAFLNRKPSAKEEVYQDLRAVRHRVDECLGVVPSS
jgi:DNA polymerase